MIRPRIGLARENLGRRIARRLSYPQIALAATRQPIRAGYTDAAPLVWHVAQRHTLPSGLHRRIAPVRRTPASRPASTIHRPPLPSPELPTAASESAPLTRPLIRPAPRPSDTRPKPPITTHPKMPLPASRVEDELPGQAYPVPGKSAAETTVSSPGRPAAETAYPGETPDEEPRPSPGAHVSAEARLPSSESEVLEPAESNQETARVTYDAVRKQTSVRRTIGRPEPLVSPAPLSRTIRRSHASRRPETVAVIMRRPVPILPALTQVRRAVEQLRPATRRTKAEAGGGFSPDRPASAAQVVRSAPVPITRTVGGAGLAWEGRTPPTRPHSPPREARTSPRPAAGPAMTDSALPVPLMRQPSFVEAGQDTGPVVNPEKSDLLHHTPTAGHRGVPGEQIGLRLGTLTSRTPMAQTRRLEERPHPIVRRQLRTPSSEEVRDVPETSIPATPWLDPLPDLAAVWSEPTARELPLVVPPPTRRPQPRARDASTRRTDFGTPNVQLGPQIDTAWTSTGPTLLQRSPAVRMSDGAPAAGDSRGAEALANFAVLASQDKGEGQPPVDLDTMAREVYRILRRRLRVEQERSQGIAIR